MKKFIGAFIVLAALFAFTSNVNAQCFNSFNHGVVKVNNFHHPQVLNVQTFAVPTTVVKSNVVTFSVQPQVVEFSQIQPTVTFVNKSFVAKKGFVNVNVNKFNHGSNSVNVNVGRFGFSNFNGFGNRVSVFSRPTLFGGTLTKIRVK